MTNEVPSTAFRSRPACHRQHGRVRDLQTEPGPGSAFRLKVGITSGDLCVFRGDKAIAPGQSVTFRLVTKNQDAGWTVTFSDDKSAFAQTSL